MKGLGVLLILFGLLAAGSMGTLNAQSEAQGVPPDQRFFQALGGACCSLTLIVPGIFMTLGRGKTRGGPYQRPSGARHPSGPESGEGSSEPDPPKPAMRAVGADGKAVVTCLACFNEVRVELPAGVKVVPCPRCEREIQVS